MKVEVLPYNRLWPALFESERSAIQNAIGHVVLKLHHIGSTAVEGLAAKAIIDMILEAHSLVRLDQATPAPESLGYEAMGELGLLGRRYFRKGGFHRSHQIHAFQSGDPNIHRHWAFRDYLNHFPEVRQEYGALKTRLALKFPEDIDGYGDGKGFRQIA